MLPAWFGATIAVRRNLFADEEAIETASAWAASLLRVCEAGTYSLTKKRLRHIQPRCRRVDEKRRNLFADEEAIETQNRNAGRDLPVFAGTYSLTKKRLRLRSSSVLAGPSRSRNLFADEEAIET